MLSRHLHFFAQALVVSTLGVILSGAVQLGGPVREPHRGLSGIAALLSFLIVVAAWNQSRRWLRLLAAGSLLTVLVLGGLGTAMTHSPWLVVAHACLSHLFFASAVSLMVATSPAWETPAKTVADTGSPSLRTLGLVVPAVVFLQIFLGAIYRLVNLPVWPHLVGSLIVGCLLLYTGMVVLESHGHLPALKKAAQFLIGITVAQLTFGLGAFLGRVMAGDGMTPEWWMTAARTLHVATGALTLGAAVAYALQVFYYVHPSTEPHPMNQGSIGKSVVA